MREAFELGWATTCVHVKARPSVVCMDDIYFRKPVEVGSLLYLSSQVSIILYSNTELQSLKNYI